MDSMKQTWTYFLFLVEVILCEYLEHVPDKMSEPTVGIKFRYHKAL